MGDRSDDSYGFDTLNADALLEAIRKGVLDQDTQLVRAAVRAADARGVRIDPMVQGMISRWLGNQSPAAPSPQPQGVAAVIANTTSAKSAPSKPKLPTPIYATGTRPKAGSPSMMPVKSEEGLTPVKFEEPDKIPSLPSDGPPIPVTAGAMLTMVKEYVASQNVTAMKRLVTEADAAGVPIEPSIRTMIERWVEGCAAKGIVGSPAAGQPPPAAQLLNNGAPQGSGQSWQKTELVEGSVENHMASVSEMRRLPCPLGCGEKIIDTEMEAHKVLECVKRKVPCALGCGLEVEFCQIDAHETTDCVKRKVPCPAGCSTLVQADMIELHAATCSKRIMKCPLGCGQEMPADKREAHKRDLCPKRPIPCPLGCGEQPPFDMVLQHVAEDCMKRQVYCPLMCGEEMEARLLEEHQAKFCPKVPKLCPNGCGAKIEKKAMEQHVASICPKRPVACPLGCQEMVALDALEDHKANDCKKRPVTCPLGCGQTGIEAGELGAHVSSQCQNREVMCPLGCGENMLAKDVFRHTNELCARRPYPCPLGCGFRDRPENLGAHAPVCPKRKVACPKGCGEEVEAAELDRHVCAPIRSKLALTAIRNAIVEGNVDSVRKGLEEADSNGVKMEPSARQMIQNWLAENEPAWRAQQEAAAAKAPPPVPLATASPSSIAAVGATTPAANPVGIPAGGGVSASSGAHPSIDAVREAIAAQDSNKVRTAIAAADQAGVKVEDGTREMINQWLGSLGQSPLPPRLPAASNGPAQAGAPALVPLVGMNGSSPPGTHMSPLLNPSGSSPMPQAAPIPSPAAGTQQEDEEARSKSYLLRIRKALMEENQVEARKALGEADAAGVKMDPAARKMVLQWLGVPDIPAAPPPVHPQLAPPPPPPPPSVPNPVLHAAVPPPLPTPFLAAPHHSAPPPPVPSLVSPTTHSAPSSRLLGLQSLAMPMNTTGVAEEPAAKRPRTDVLGSMPSWAAGGGSSSTTSGVPAFPAVTTAASMEQPLQQTTAHQATGGSSLGPQSVPPAHPLLVAIRAGISAQNKEAVRSALAAADRQGVTVEASTREMLKDWFDEDAASPSSSQSIGVAQTVSGTGNKSQGGPQNGAPPLSPAPIPGPFGEGSPFNLAISPGPPTSPAGPSVGFTSPTAKSIGMPGQPPTPVAPPVSPMSAPGAFTAPLPVSAPPRLEAAPPWQAQTPQRTHSGQATPPWNKPQTHQQMSPGAQATPPWQSAPGRPEIAPGTQGKAAGFRPISHWPRSQ